MYLSELSISNFRQFGAAQQPFMLTLQPGVTAPVGENDCGKTAVVDAIRYALLTRDLDYVRVHAAGQQRRSRCSRGRRADRGDQTGRLVAWARAQRAPSTAAFRQHKTNTSPPAEEDQHENNTDETALPGTRRQTAKMTV